MNKLKLFFLPFLFVRTVYWQLDCVFKFKFKKVTYDEFPRVFGKIIIYNNGYCAIGRNVTFKSKFNSNLVGITKPCSMYVGVKGKLVIGDNCGLSGVTIYCSNSIQIGKFVNIGGNVSIWDTDFHPLDFMERREHKIDSIKTAAINIGDDVFIGANAIILKGVTIGSRSIVGAGSVVTTNIGADEVWGGNPAKFIRKNEI